MISQETPAEMREVLGADADGMTDEQLIALRDDTDKLAFLIVESFEHGVRAPREFVPTLDEPMQQEHRR